MQKQDHPKEQKHGGSHVVKRKVRFDRIAAVVVPLLLIVILIGALCLRSCQKSGKLKLPHKAETTTAATTVTESNPTQTTTPVATDTTAPTEQLEHTDGKEITLPANDWNKGNLIVINKEHEYSFPIDDPVLSSIHENRNSSYSVSDHEVELETETLEHLNEMMADYEAETGFNGMEIFAGYRSSEDQESRYENGNSDFHGGYSDYHTGRSFNLKIKFGDGTSDYYNAEKYPEYSWIAENAASYGFVVRYPEGKDDYTGDESRTYTFRYVGVPHAAYMTENDLCMEEYVENLQQYTADAPLEVAAEGTNYQIFYVPAESGSTKATVPSEAYTISGDNIGGYIITCVVE